MECFRGRSVPRDANDVTGGSNALVVSADGRDSAAMDPAISFDGGRVNDIAVHGERLVAIGQLSLPNTASGDAGDAAVGIGPRTNAEAN